jgi:hypothetical protein
LFTQITMVLVCQIHGFHEGPVIVGLDMKRGWSLKPLLAPRKVD